MRFRSIAPIKCVFSGHHVKKEKQDQLFSPTFAGAHLKVRCRTCNTPLQIIRVGSNKFKVKQIY